MNDHHSRNSRSLRLHLMGGLAVLGILGGGVGVWASTTELSGAVIAAGLLVVDTNVKRVQHPNGGIVGEIRVKDGDRVSAGDLLVRLDETVTRANLAVVTKSLDELAARQGRLEAERDGRAEIVVHDDLSRRASDPEAAALMAGEQRLFDLRREARAGQKAQLEQRVDQLREQIEGLQLQTAAKTDEIALIRDELKGVQDLWRKNLIPMTRLTALKREETRLLGEKGQLIASVAQTKARISETELQIIQIDQDLRSEVAKELRELQGKTAELVERKVAAADHLKRIEIRAPQTGVVHQLSVHTVGGVVAAGDTLMLVVPEGEELAVEVTVAPQDIDQIKIGQEAVLRLSAFSQRTTPEIDARVSRVAADLTKDERSGLSHYTVRLAPHAGGQAQLRSLKLVPGMPVEAFIRTGERTVLSYLTKPLTDQMTRAFRED
jgi:HlyD family secretion protein